jgi:hypothetical protein
MNWPSFLATREARNSFKDKFEVFMAVVVISKFVYDKAKKAQETPELENQEQ